MSNLTRSLMLGGGAAWTDQTGTALRRPDGSSVAVGVGQFSGPSIVAVLGDSISDNSYVTANISAYKSVGFVTWAMAFSMGTLWCPLACEITNATPKVKYNRAVSGETAEQALARVSELDALPVRPRFCSVMTGTNNLTINPTQTAESIVSTIVGICSALTTRGIVPVLCTLLPRGNGTSAGWGALSAGQISTARGRLLEINRRLRSSAAVTQGVILADTWSAIANFASATSDPQVGLTIGDYLHPNVPGAVRIGQLWWQAVSPFVSPAIDNANGAGDAWSISDNPFGSQINSAFGASGGTASTGTSGTVPSGWTAGRFAGSSSTAVIAQQVRVDGKNGYECTIAMTGSDTASFRIYEGASTLTNANFSAGDAFYVEGDVVFNGTGANQYANPDFECRVAGSGVTAWAAHTLGADGAMQGNYTFRLRTPLLEVPSGGMTGSNSVWTKDSIASGGSATVTRRNIVLRKYNKSAPGAVTW